MNSGVTVLPGVEFVGFWKRALAALIDAVIGFAQYPLTMSLTAWSFEHRTSWPLVVDSIAWTLLFMYLVVRFGCTPGKLIIRARIVNERGMFLSWGAALRRMFPGLALTVVYHLQLHTAVTTYPGFETSPAWSELGQLPSEYGGIFSTIALWLVPLIYLDILVVLFNAHKRALHDYLAGSFVVTRVSLQTARQAG